MNKVRKFFENKTPKQTFSICLMVTIVLIMLLCVVSRLFGLLWFSADVQYVTNLTPFWQARIMNLLFIFEVAVIYKILCRTNWFYCIGIATIQCFLIALFFAEDSIVVPIVNLVLMFVLPYLFNKKLAVLIDVLFLYCICTLYAIVFLYGRIGVVLIDNSYDYIYNILGIIDYKAFIVSVYMIQINFGGIRIWKNRKILTL